MRLETYTGESTQEILKKIREDWGDDVVIVTTKQIKRKTLTSPGLYEIVVGIEDNNLPQKNQKNINSLNNNKKDIDEEDVLLSISKVAKEISKIEVADEFSGNNINKNNNLVNNFNNSNSNRIAVTENNLNSNANYKKDLSEFKLLKKDLEQLSDRVKLIQSNIWAFTKNSRNNLHIPPEFAEIYALAKNSGMSVEHLNEIMTLTLQHMPAKMRNNTTSIKRYFNVLLRKMIPIRLESLVVPPSKKIMMFVGPTGVGKTTTLAKLAARFAYTLNSKKYKVGIITLDTYRIGAVEQLINYAKMMKLEIHTVIDPADFTKALNSLKHCDYILIDTAGSSQNDVSRLKQLELFLQVDTYTSIDVNLVLSANVKYEDLVEIYRRFEFLNIDTLIFTKLDETNTFGNIFSLVYDIKKPISYLSTGQIVPDDLKVATSEYLVECMLDGFKKDNK